MVVVFLEGLTIINTQPPSTHRNVQLLKDLFSRATKIEGMGPKIEKEPLLLSGASMASEMLGLLKKEHVMSSASQQATPHKASYTPTNKNNRVRTWGMSFHPLGSS